LLRLPRSSACLMYTKTVHMTVSPKGVY
jgi:hypothetical protein